MSQSCCHCHPKPHLVKFNEATLCDEAREFGYEYLDWYDDAFYSDIEEQEERAEIKYLCVLTTLY